MDVVGKGTKNLLYQRQDPLIGVGNFVVTEINFFPLDLVLSQGLVKNVLVQGIVAVEVENGRGGDQEIGNVLEDFEP